MADLTPLPDIAEIETISEENLESDMLLVPNGRGAEPTRLHLQMKPYPQNVIC